MYITPVVNSLYFNRPIGVSKQKADRSFVEQKSAVATTPSFKATVGDAYAAQIAKTVKERQMADKAKDWLIAMATVANECAPQGVSINLNYCKKSPIKDSSEYVRKMLRTGETEVRDWIRGTLYVENLYDLSILRDYILPAFKKEGYIPAPIKLTPEKAIERHFIPSAEDFRTGVMEVQDISIRLQDASKHAAKTAPELLNYVDGPAKSGYEDIQIHFLCENFKGEPIYHELLLLFGENYAQAKSIESERIYGILRKLSTLSILTNGEMNTREEMLFKEYIDKVKNMFTVEASKKLFGNAKNMDFYKIDEQEKISFNLMHEAKMNECFISLEEMLEDFYKQKISKCKNNPELKRKYYKERKADAKLLRETRMKLKESIDFFNKDYGKIKPKKPKNQNK